MEDIWLTMDPALLCDLKIIKLVFSKLSVSLFETVGLQTCKQHFVV